MLTFTYPEKTVIEISNAATGERITLSRQIKVADIVYEVNGGTGGDMKRIAYEMEKAFSEVMRKNAKDYQESLWAVDAMKMRVMADIEREHRAMWKS